MTYHLGVDLGGTNIAVGVAQGQTRLVAKVSRPTGVGRPWEVIADDIAAACRQALDQAGLTTAQCGSVGVGVPGVCGPGGQVVYASNLCWEKIPLAQRLSAALELPVELSNDANCAALGEVVAGAAKGIPNTVLVTLGTGVGGGIILDGRIYQGGWQAGGELGHMVIHAGGELCGCGRRGCWEAYASATALIRQAKRAAQAHPDSLLVTLCGGQLEGLEGRTVFDAASQGDRTAIEVVDAYEEYLAEGLANLVNIFRPQCILLGGGISHQGEALLAPVRQLMAARSYGGDCIPVPKLAAATLGNDAGILGAAALSKV